MSRERLAAATGIPLVIAWILILALTGNSPDDNSSDHKILSYYASHGHRVRDIVVFFVAAVAAAFFVWFLGVLRSVLLRAEGEPGRLATTATASGAAFIALFAVAGSVFTAPSFITSDAGHKFALDPNTFRLLNGIGLLVFVGAFLLAAPLAFATGLIVWRTRVLPRWLAVASFIAGIACIVGFLFFTTFVFFAWILILSLYLVSRPSPGPRPISSGGTA